MGAIITTAIKVLLMWLQNRFDPEMIKLRELKSIRYAKEAELDEIEVAVSTGDTARVSELFRRLSPSN